MLATLLKVAAVALVAYILVVLLAWRFQERLAFPSPKASVPDPRTFGFVGGERVTTVTTDGIRLHGWYLPPQTRVSANARVPGLLWFYGNMETVRDLAPLFRELQPPEVGLLVFDYRGYGESEGRPTEAGLYRDADAAWTFLKSRPDIDSTRIAVYGRSLGSAVALYVASQYPVRSVILDSPFSTARAMADRHYPIVPSILLRLRLDNLQRVSNLEVPLLVLHGADDRIAPLDMGQSVAETAPLGRIVVIDGAGHNDTYQFGQYGHELHSFLSSHLADPGTDR